MDFVNLHQSINRQERADLRQNSWMIRIDKNTDYPFNEQLPGQFVDGRMVLEWDFEVPDVCWEHCSAGQFELFLEGHLYLADSLTLDAKANLQGIAELLRHERPVDIGNYIAGGLFVLIIYDRLKRELTILHDEYGAMPVFCWDSYETIYISSNVFTIHKHAENSISETSLCPIATVEFLKYGYLPFSDSIFHDVIRLRPSQNAVVDCESSRVNIGRIHLPSYLPPDMRYQSMDEAGFALHKAISEYFARFSSAEYFLGLSGGYDSRLLANAVKKFSPRCLNFGYPESTETQLAAEIAGFLNAGFTTESFPEDLIAKHGATIADKQRIMFTLEYAHVSHLQQRVREAEADFFLDGFVGDVVLGSGYFYKKGGSPKDLFNYLFLTMNVNEPGRANPFYEDMLYNDPEAISDAELSGVMTGGIRAEIMKRIRRSLETVRDSAELHFDIIEAAKHYTRGRNLIAGGPVGIGNYARSACLFVDSRVRAVCMNTNKKLRIANGLYNHYWRKYLPELSQFRKAGSSGSPSDPAWLYRAKDVAAALGRRIVNPLSEKLLGASPQVEQAYFSNERYLSNEANLRYIEETVEAPDRHLPLVISEKLKERYDKNRLSPSLLLRYVTLNSYLGEGKKP